MKTAIISINNPLYIPCVDELIRKLSQEGHSVVSITEVPMKSKNQSFFRFVREIVQFWGLRYLLLKSPLLIMSKLFSFFNIFLPFPSAYTIRGISEKHGTRYMKTPDVNSEKYLQRLGRQKPDLIISFCPQIFKREILNLTKHGCINKHSSLLPEYRGMCPVFRAMLNNERYTGVTIHRMTEKIDSGRILVQQSIEIGKNDTLDSLYRKAHKLVPGLIVEAMKVLEGKKSIFKSKTDSKGSYYSNPKPKDILEFKKRGKRTIVSSKINLNMGLGIFSLALFAWMLSSALGPVKSIIMMLATAIVLKFGKRGKRTIVFFNKIKEITNNLNYKQIFIICFAAIAIFSTLSPIGPNDRSRYLNIASIVKNQSLILDEELERFDTIKNQSLIIDEKLEKFDTMDKLFINGHFYSDKPPMFAITFSPVYYTARLLNISVYNKYLYKFSIILIPGFFFAFAMSLFYKEYAAYFESEKWLLLLLIFATPYYVFNRVLMSHGLVGSMLYISFYFIRRKSRNLFMSLAGLLSGLAVTYDHGAIFIFFSFILYLLLTKKIKELILLISFSLIPVSVHLAIVYQISGSILPLNMHPEYLNYPGSLWLNNNEVTGSFKHSSIPSLLGYISALLFAFHGYRPKGLFLTAPILIFAFIQMIREVRAVKFEALSLFSGILLLFVYYALVSNNLSGGDHVVRWFILFMPLCLPYIARFSESSCRNIKVRGWFNFALIISLLISLSYSFISWLSGRFTPLF